MDPIEKMERQREAQRRLSAQRQRAGRLRSRAVAVSLISFVLLWGVVFTQMAIGNDPVLSAKSAATSASRAATESIETSAPEEVERELAEPEPVEEEPAEEEELFEAEPETSEEELIEAEIEAAELEAAEEPAPVTSSQS